METLASRHPLRLTRSQLGVLAGFKPSGGTFGTYFSTLKTTGLITIDGNLITASDAGLAYANVAPAAPTTSEELLRMWQSKLKRGPAEMLGYLVRRYPDTATREELAAAVEMTASGGSFGTYISTLKTNGLIEVNGQYVRTSDSLFLENLP